MKGTITPRVIAVLKELRDDSGIYIDEYRDLCKKDCTERLSYATMDFLRDNGLIKNSTDPATGYHSNRYKHYRISPSGLRLLEGRVKP